MLLAALFVLFAAAPAAARSLPESFADLVEKIEPAVVNISTTQEIESPQFFPGVPLPELPEGSPFKEFFERFFSQPEFGGRPQPQRRPVNSLGSGFIVDRGGFVATNSHVIENATEIKVTLHDGRQLDAEVIGRDDKTDLALLKIEAGGDLPAVRFGDSDEMRPGDWVIAIGNPFGLGGTVTFGVVSARNRVIDVGGYNDFLQLDAAINRGNSGGPSFNARGEVIGINTAIFSPTGGSVGIGFAIPANTARNVLDQLKESGRVERGWLGVQIQPVSPEVAESLGLEQAQGALVAKVEPDSPAAAAGLQTGDVVIRYDGRDIEQVRDLVRSVADTRAGERVGLVVWRQGREKRLEVRIRRRDEQVARVAPAPDEAGPGARLEFEALGLTLGALSAEARRRYGLEDDVDGAVVASVQPGSAAAEAGLRSGDVIIGVGQEKVASPDDVAGLIKQARSDKQKWALLLVLRNGAQHFAPLGIG